MARRTLRRTLLATGLLAATLAMVSGALGQPNAAIEEAIDAECYLCHWNWEPPMKTAYRLLEQDAGGAIGAPFDVAVQVQNAWISDLVEFRPVLDLAGAPSLSFTDGQEPTSTLIDGSIEVTATSPAAAQDGSVQVPVLGNTTDLIIRLTPARAGPTGPDLTLIIETGDPNQDPFIINDASAGETESLVLHGGDTIAGLGLGTWTVTARAAFASPVLAEPRFTVTADAWYNSSASTKQFLVSDDDVTGGQSTLFTWTVVANAAPAPGESIDLTVNGTAHYAHTSVADDWGNFTKTITLPVTGSSDGAGVVIGTGRAVAPEVDLNAGASMARISEAIGYATAFLLIGSVVTGGLFGKTSRRLLNKLFGAARRRVGFHNFLSYGLTVAALAHLVLFIIETNYAWTLGIIWGGIAFLAMMGLGVTGALQVPIIRRWNYPSWRWTHLALAIASLVFTVVHLLLDGVNFTFVQEAIGYSDPFPDKSGA